MGQKTGNPRSRTEGICLEVGLAAESTRTAHLGPRVSQKPFGGQLMAQGANAGPQKMSVRGLLTLFPRESPVESGEGHPGRGQQARPVLEPLP